MCLLWGIKGVFMSQKTAFFIVTAVKTSNLSYKLVFNNIIRSTMWQSRKWCLCDISASWSYYLGVRKHVKSVSFLVKNSENYQLACPWIFTPYARNLTATPSGIHDSLKLTTDLCIFRTVRVEERDSSLDLYQPPSITQTRRLPLRAEARDVWAALTAGILSASHRYSAGVRNSNSKVLVRLEVLTVRTVKNAVFWDIKFQFVPHRWYITSPLQSPAG
jgi:hypothetical protein